MWPHRVVVSPPAIDQDLRFTKCVKDLTVEQLVTQLAVEALNKPVLPRTPRLDVQCRHPHIAQPVSDRFGCKLSTVVRADVLWDTSRCHEPCESLKHIAVAEIPRHINRKALPRMLVDHREHPKAPTVVRSRLDEVVAPDMVLVLGSKPHA